MCVNSLFYVKTITSCQLVYHSDGAHSANWWCAQQFRGGKSQTVGFGNIKDPVQQFLTFHCLVRNLLLSFPDTWMSPNIQWSAI